MRRKFSDYILKPEGRHELEVYLIALFYLTVLTWAVIHGQSYYRLPLDERPFHALNRERRPDSAPHQCGRTEPAGDGLYDE